MNADPQHSVKVPKCEIFDLLDCLGLYIIKPLRGWDCNKKIEKIVLVMILKFVGRTLSKI